MTDPATYDYVPVSISLHILHKSHVSPEVYLTDDVESFKLTNRIDDGEDAQSWYDIELSFYDTPGLEDYDNRVKQWMASLNEEAGKIGHDIDFILV
jgi:hypothetical protein